MGYRQFKLAICQTSGIYLSSTAPLFIKLYFTKLNKMKNLILKHLSYSTSIGVIFTFFLFGNVGFGQCGNLYIAGVIDGPLSGGVPKGALFCASGNIADLSIYGAGTATNGGGSSGADYTFPALPASAGDCFWIGSSTNGFMDFFGFEPCFTSGSFSINGDDAVELFCSGAVVDVYGDVNLDGTGQPWDYRDGWGASADMTANPTFDPNEWTFSGTDALDGASNNAGASPAFPIDTQQCPGATMPTCMATLVAGTATCDAETSGTDTYTATFTFTAGTATSYTVSVTNANGTTAATVTTSGTITVTGAMEGTDVIISVSDGADCDLTATVTSPSCLDPSTTADVYISELSFNPCTDQGPDGDCEYIIITNAGSTTADISGYMIANGISYTFPAGTMIPAGGTLSLGVSANCTGLQSFDLVGFAGSLSNSSNETIEILEPGGGLISSITYDGSLGDGNCMANCFDAMGAVSECPSSLALMTSCMATLAAGTATCDAETSGVDSYTATFTFTAGTATSYTVSVTNVNGTTAATVTASGTITVTGATEGTDVILSVSDGADCDLMATVTSPACNEPTGAVCPGAFFSEISYECTGNDINEAIEVCIPNSFTGMLSDLAVDLYNGSDNETYPFTLTLDNFTVGTNDGTKTFYSIALAPNTIQNGAPDGLSLSYQGVLCEFLSYEGTITALDGPAVGVTSTDVGVAQSSGSDCGESIQLIGGGWALGCATLGDANSDSPCMATCPDLSAAAPPAVIVSDSDCSTGTLTGGEIGAPATDCPTGSSVEYSVDNGTSWGALPTYATSGPAQTIITRCLCDSDMMTASPPSTSVTTAPGTCGPACDASISAFPANGN